MKKKLPIQYIPAALYVSPILEHMGYIPIYFNLDETQSFPTSDLKNNYAGIVLWLEKQDLKHVALLNWIHKQIKNGVRVVFLNSFGVPIETKTLAQMGLFAASLQDTIATLTITKMDSKFVGYEVQPIETPYYFYPIQSRSSNILLQLRNTEQQTEDAVAITAWGGYALNPYVIPTLPNATSRWVINPFEFFQQALLLQDFPIPDTTTENGRRLMSVHIDGDGFAYPAKWINGHFAAEELRDRVLKKFPIPTSFSVITGEIAPNGTQPGLSPQLMGIAQSIFTLPWIEIASHSFSHPFDWQVTEKTNFKQPAMQIHPTRPYSAESYQRASGGVTPYPRQGRNDVVVTGIESEQPYALKIPNYKFNLKDEITGSIDFINKNLAPPHKKSHLFFWSGLANPSAQALALAQQNQLLNINGLSNTNIDISNPSLTSIRPMGLAVGGYYQVFAPIQMDFFYMNSFLGPMYGFEKVIQTFQLTDKPRRFKPIDLYYHIYSASQPASLKALLSVYRWALAQPVMNIYISEYIEKVLDFYHIEIGKYHNAWTIYSHGDLRELRSSSRFGYPDLVHSSNVIGFQENKSDRYIHLGPNRFTVLNYQHQKPTEPYLVEANARVTNFVRDSQQIVIKFQGHMPLKFTLENVEQCLVVSQEPLNTQKNKDNTVSYFSSKDCGEIHINCG